MMIEINALDEKFFTLNGVKRPKIYEAREGTEDDEIAIVSAYRDGGRITTRTAYVEFKIDGAVPASRSEAISRINEVVFG